MNIANPVSDSVSERTSSSWGFVLGMFALVGLLVVTAVQSIRDLDARASLPEQSVVVHFTDNLIEPVDWQIVGTTQDSSAGNIRYWGSEALASYRQ